MTAKKKSSRKPRMSESRKPGMDEFKEGVRERPAPKIDLNEPVSAAEAPPHIDEALQLFQQAHQTMQAGVFKLNDGKRFFDGIEPAERARIVRAISNFLEATQFNMGALIDEMKLLRKKKVGTATAASAARFNVPTIDEALAAADGNGAAKVGVPVLTAARDHSRLALTVLAHHEVEVMHSKPYVDACNYFAAQVDALGLAIAKQGGEA